MPGDFVTVRPDRYMINDMVALIAPKLNRLNIDVFAEPEKAVVALDHFVPAQPKHRKMLGAAMAVFHKLGLQNDMGETGIAHQVMCEKGFIKPGTLVVGTDSHSTLYGALGAAGAGIGATEMTYLLATGELWFEVPESVRVDLSGQLPKGVYAKDVMLGLLKDFGADYAQYKSVEYVGDLARGLSISERMTLSNMGAEFGAKFAMFEADAKTVEYLRNVTGEATIFGSDEDAQYEEWLGLNVDNLEPQIACPHSPDNIENVSSVAGQNIDQAYLGSCTNARLDDIALAAEILEGQSVAKDTRLVVVPASQQVMEQAKEAGYVQVLEDAGATFMPSGCGACAGLHSNLLEDGEVCLATINRNFAGRMGSPKSEVFLGSPAVIAASAITGHISDPRDVRPELFL